MFDFEVRTLIQNHFSFNISGAVTHMVLIPLPQRSTRERHVTGLGAFSELSSTQSQTSRMNFFKGGTQEANEEDDAQT